VTCDKESLNPICPALGPATKLTRGCDAVRKGDFQNMSQQHEEQAIEVLRTLWGERGQSLTDLDAIATPKGCKRMADVGFGELDGEDGGDLRAAWRETLKREGKLRSDQGSLRDLMLGPPDSN
jgi:hypothetical protein